MTRGTLKRALAYRGDAYAIGRTWWFAWVWQTADRVGAYGGVTFSKDAARRAARWAMRDHKASFQA